MAEADVPQQPEVMPQDGWERLKYLDFVQVATLNIFTCFSTLYEYAKENSGPLKPGVRTVEGTVKTVISPVYEKFQDVPFELLKFVDHKVDQSVSEIERHVPSLIKQVSSHAFMAAQKAPEVARAVASEVQRAGVVETAADIAKTAYVKCEPTAKNLYAKYEPVAERYAVTAWRALNRLPLFPQVAQIVVPTAAYWSYKYNYAVYCAGEREYTVAVFLPLIPVERIAKVFGETEEDEAGPTVTMNPIEEGETASVVAQ
ncbi:stress-related protein [Macadamia integrifolia]|uniref:stress-related protein n=1 Tax=Macadamia integrifolia TaxID=60698 RepID=UPI001C4EA399|nr:stress-related protein [Macadamia integrifolia]